MKRIVMFSIMVLLITSCRSGQVNRPDPADRSASPRTVKLLSGIYTAQEKGIMFGHQDDLAYGIGWAWPHGESDVKRVCGDYPAVYGMDLGHIEHLAAANLDTVPFSEMRQFAREIWTRGGIITFSWHADNPLTGSNAWDISTDKTVASVLPGGENHEKYKKWLDNVAAFFASLTDDSGEAIPVIFRPYHEHTGSWFWWGQKLCTKDDFVALWRFTFNYLTSEKNIHNLLFAYSSSGDIENAQQYLERYPGDDYVDIIGFDYYQMPQTGSGQFTEAVNHILGIVTGIAAEHGKVAALTEAGYESIPDSTWWTGALWPAVKDHKIAYLLVWRNANNILGHFYAPYPGQASEKDFIDFYNLPATLFQKDLTALGIYN